MDASTKKSAQPRRRWFRFRLRTLLIVATVLSVTLGWVGWRLGQVRRERATIAWIEEADGKVFFNYRNDISWWEESTDKWFGERVRQVYFHYALLDFRTKRVSDLSPLVELKSLKVLHLQNVPMSDLSSLAELKSLKVLHLSETQVRDLSPLTKLRNLKKLVLHKHQVRDKQVQELRQALPNCEIRHSIRVEKIPTNHIL